MGILPVPGVFLSPEDPEDVSSVSKQCWEGGGWGGSETVWKLRIFHPMSDYVLRSLDMINLGCPNERFFHGANSVINDVNRECRAGLHIAFSHGVLDVLIHSACRDEHNYTDLFV